VVRSPLELFPSRAHAERLAGAGPPRERALAELLGRIPALLSSRALVYSMGGEGDEPRRIAATEDDVTRALAEMDRGRREGVATPFIIADDPAQPNLVLSFGSETVAGVEKVDLALPPAREEQPAGLEAMMELISTLGTAFGAHTAFFEDPALAHVYFARRVADFSRRSSPPELRDRVPEPKPLPGVAGSLPELLVVHEFDRRRVPRGVFWINYWSRIQVETLGRERVESAEWERVVREPEGALTLAATETPPDPKRAEDLERLRAIVEHLDLRAAQERYRIR
jgi:hypothetical protein